MLFLESNLIKFYKNWIRFFSILLNRFSENNLMLAIDYYYFIISKYCFLYDYI